MQMKKKKKTNNCERQFYHQNGSHSTQTLARTDALCKLGSSMKMLALHLFPLSKLKADRQLIFGWVSRSQMEVMSWVVLGYPNLRVSPSWISGQSLLFPGDRLWNHSQGLRGPWCWFDHNHPSSQPLTDLAMELQKTEVYLVGKEVL